jgi:hypothetical protein
MPRDPAALLTDAETAAEFCALGADGFKVRNRRRRAQARRAYLQCAMTRQMTRIFYVRENDPLFQIYATALEAATPADDRHLWMLRLAVDFHYGRTPPLGQALVVFEDTGWRVDPNGQPCWLVPELVTGSDFGPRLIELVAVDADDPGIFHVGRNHFDVLGEGQLWSAVQNRTPLLIHETPLDWWRAGGAGICVLDWDGFAVRETLRRLRSVRCGTRDFAKIVHACVKRAPVRLPDILAPKVAA